MADDAYGQVRELIRDGAIGKIVHVQAGYFRRGDWGERMPIPDPNAKPGPDLDWEQFLGDAPKVPFTVSRFFQWRLYWDYSGGPATDLLVHTFTPLFCLLDVDFPERTIGARRHVPVQRSPRGARHVQHDHRLPGRPERGADEHAVQRDRRASTFVRGTDGTLTFRGREIVFTRHDAKEPSHVIACPGFGDTAALWANLLDCVQSRQTPLSPVDVGAQVQAPLNMAILSYRENKVARFDTQKQEIVL